MPFRNHLFMAVVLVCIANGLVSPFVLGVFALWPVWFPTMLFSPTPELVFYLSSLIVSTTTLLLSGVPAALFERLTGRAESTPASIAVWLAGAVLLSLPSAIRVSAGA